MWHRLNETPPREVGKYLVYCDGGYDLLCFKRCTGFPRSVRSDLGSWYWTELPPPPREASGMWARLLDESPKRKNRRYLIYCNGDYSISHFGADHGFLTLPSSNPASVYWMPLPQAPDTNF